MNGNSRLEAFTEKDHSGGRGREAGEREESFGELINSARSRRNYSLQNLAGKVKVPMKYLEALEDEDFASLPPKTYVRGFLEALCRELALDLDEVVRRYEDSLREHSRSLREDRRGAVFALFRPQGEKFQLRDWSIPVTLALLVVLFLAGQRIFGLGDGGEEAYLPAPQVALPEALIESAIPAGNSVAASQPVRTTPTAAVGVRMHIRAEGATWLSAESDGLGAQEWTLRGGEIKELTAARKLVLSLGNAGVVKLTFNERELGFIGQQGEVKRDLVFVASEE